MILATAELNDIFVDYSKLIVKVLNFVALFVKEGNSPPSN